MPRGGGERRGDEQLAAIARGVELPDAQLPKFPRAPRWERDPQFDDRVSALKRVRDAAAQRLDLDPGVMCSRDRMEAVARRNPSSMEELQEVRELRRWQIEELGEEFLAALRGIKRSR
jgi:ribonuclease D